MNLESFYENIGGRADEVLRRMPGEAFLIKFLKKFLSDKTFCQLESALENKERELSFRLAHTLKGICLNLGLSRLYEPVNELTEILRPCDESVDMDRAGEFMKNVSQEYHRVVAEIEKID